MSGAAGLFTLVNGAQDDCARLSALRRRHPRIIVGLSLPQMKLDRYARRAFAASSMLSG
jgi:hypothetical protein